jgi:prenylcysteine oxidase/farnesylcysteine lyase
MRPLAAALCLAPLLAAPLAAAAAAADAASLPPPPLRIAIIGAGPGGTSAAYWLARAQQQLDAAALLSAESQAAGGGQRTAVPLRDAFDVTVYEREERIGGRTAIVHPHDDDSLEAIELGASIFADVNYNLKRAAKVRLAGTGVQGRG